MFKKPLQKDEVNFWISYADLMAGLLFVFILLIGAIVVKSIILKTDLKSNEASLKSNQNQLQQLKNKIIILQTLLKDTNNTLNKQLLTLSNQLHDTNQSIKLKDDEILKLANLLGAKETKYEQLVQELQKTKTKIKNLTGIKIKVIAKLKEALGKKIVLDTKSGSIRVASNVLFDKGNSTLKPGGKKELKKIFADYIAVLVEDKNIKKHLDKIIIEGHTDSDGTYLYNLELSQKRAYEVMNFILGLDFAKKHNIKQLIVASGRSYLDTIKKNTKEDKVASRRIEIKFSLKNEDAMREIERILEHE